jgi:predicted dehydrogenase
LIFDAEPQRVFALTSEDPRFAVDRFATAVLEFADGHASFFCSTQSSRYQMVQIIGTTGWIRVEVPFAHPPDLSARIVIGRDIIPGTEPVETITLPPVNQYQLQAERFSRQIRGIETTQWPLETAVANMRVIDAIRASAQTGGWINIE